MAAGAGIVVVLAIFTVIVTRPSGSGSRVTARPSPYPAASRALISERLRPLSLGECQAAIADQLDPIGQQACGYETAGLDRLYDEPSADPADPRYAGAALPTGLSTDGRNCVAGPGRPVLDTVRPTLSASFTAVPGLRRIGSTFQITGVYGRTAEDQQLPGDPGDPLTATMDFRWGKPLRHGESYRWRVRGTPPAVGAAGWSPWCEFTIPESTPDDLGLDDDRDYRAVLTAAEWLKILNVVPVSAPYVPIDTAAKAATSPATQVPVTLTGRAWFLLVNDLAYQASDNDDQAIWKLADLLSSALGGPDRPTMGHPRT